MTHPQNSAEASGKSSGNTGVDFARAGEGFHLRGETETALRMLADGLRSRPRNVTGRLVLARVCLDSGRVDEGRDWLESALRLDPGCPAALMQLAELADGPDHQVYRQRLLTREPWDDFMLPATKYGIDPEEVAQHETRNEPAPETRPPSDAEEEELPEDEDPANLPHVATVTLAEIYFQQGLKEQAAQIYRQLLERQPGDVSTKKRLEEIETSIAGPDPRATDRNG